MNFNLLTWIDSTNPTAGGISGTSLATNQFAEFGINLTQALGLGGKCFAFPQQVWESRSSGSSFTSNPQDIEIEHHIIQNCGEVQIIKQTDPRGQDQDFGFSSTIPSPRNQQPGDAQLHPVALGPEQLHAERLPERGQDAGQHRPR